MRTFEIGSVLCHDSTDPGVPYSYAAVLPLVREYPGEHSAWVMGQTYLIQFIYIEDGEKKRNTRLVKMPDEVSDGKMAVIDVNVTKKLDKWWEKRQTLTVRVRGEILPPHMILHVWNPERLWPQEMYLDSKGRATVEMDPLGGDLRLASTKLPPPPATQHREFALPVWYVQSVTDREVTLPDDADIVIGKEEAIEVRLKVPPPEMPADTVAIGLVARRESHLSLAHGEVKKAGSGLARLRCAPGTYHVAAYGANSSAWGVGVMGKMADSLDHDDGLTVIGKITVRESDAGKTLEMQPLEE